MSVCTHIISLYALLFKAIICTYYMISVIQINGYTSVIGRSMNTLLAIRLCRKKSPWVMHLDLRLGGRWKGVGNQRWLFGEWNIYRI